MDALAQERGCRARGDGSREVIVLFDPPGCMKPRRVRRDVDKLYTMLEHPGKAAA
jgi:hypothetical protein